MKPKFKHNCNNCIFLGNTIDKNNLKHDLYFCKSIYNYTVIARYGNKAQDYQSGLGFNIDVLKQAELLAKEKNLLS